MPDDLLCHNCGTGLTPGQGDFYVVRIEALADPTPPHMSSEDLEKTDFDAEYRRLIDAMRDMSEQELLNQVYRTLTIHLCRRCYLAWIENPTG